MRLRVDLAGQMAVVHDGATVPTDGLGRLGRLALAYLISERPRPVNRDELAEVLWGGDPPRTWETSLRVVVSKLRAALAETGLPAGIVATAPSGYRLDVPPGTDVVVDVEAAEQALTDAENALGESRPEDAGRLAAAAAAVAARPFMGGAGGSWAERRQDELRALRLRALVLAADAALAAGDPAGALVVADEAVSMEPFREAGHQRVMAAHGAAGNRAEALRAYERCRRLLAEELGVPPSRSVQDLYERLLLDDDEVTTVPGAVAAVPAPAPPAYRLPRPATSFVGRQRELSKVGDLLGRTRLLTLLGTGGVGKTRLALELAAGSGTEVALVELGAASGPGAVVQEALAALGLREEPGLDPVASLVTQLGERRLLVLLDNCEHLVEQSAAMAAAVLERCPAVTVLATSREPLRVEGEMTWRVPSLARVEAEELFLSRARAARPDGDWDTGSPAVAQVCRRLDGIPLALELAAARTRALSVDEIAVHLDDAFRLLTGGARDRPPRHQTLRATVEWTYRGLAPHEATLFDRLAVFAGAFTAAAAEQVCAGGELQTDDVLVVLAGLVDRSLVVAEPVGAATTRYRLLETLRQYGRERLGGTDEAPAVRDRHLAWAMEVAGRADRRLAGPDQAAGLEVMEAAHDDLRAALSWATRVSAEAALRLAGDLGRFWEIRGHLSQGRALLASALAMAPSGQAPAPSPARARALDWAGILAQQQGDYTEAATRFRASLAVHRALGHDRGVAAGLHGLGNLAALEGDLAEARRLYAESLAMGLRTGDAEVQAAALANLGSVAENQGELVEAEALLEESLAIRRRLGDDHAIALVTGNLGFVALLAGDGARARRLLGDSLAMRRRLGDRSGEANALANLGAVAIGEGSWAKARELLESSLELAEEVGDRRAATLALLRLARAARASGDLDAAVGFDRRAMPSHGHLRAKRTIAEWLEGVAATAVALGSPGRAAGLLGAAGGLRAAIGAPVPATERGAVSAVAVAARAALGPDGFDRAEVAGRRLGVDEAVSFAWRDMPGVAPPPR